MRFKSVDNNLMWESYVNNISNCPEDESEVVMSFENSDPECILEEAEYHGKKVTLNKPSRSGDQKHKFYVYVKNDKGNVIKLGFGDPNMEIKRDNPKRLKSYRARHHCNTNLGPKWKANYWSCKFWEKGKSVSDLLDT